MMMITKSLWRACTFLFALALLAIVPACGGTPAARESTAASAEPTAAPVVGETAQPASSTSVPVSEATPTPVPPSAQEPMGTLNAGLPELGPYNGHPMLVKTPALNINNSAPIGEGLMILDINLEPKGRLLKSWSISEDYTTWTLELQQGVQFHKGYGEMTSEDVVWSYVEGWAKNETHFRTSQFRDFWAHPEGSVETPDPYTVVVDTGVPLSAAGVRRDWMTSLTNWVASKRQVEELGAEAAGQNPALTGSWEIVEHLTGQFWKMQAVKDHWRQTPYFEELVFWEIPEESARIAGFQTGNLDTFTMSIDSIPLVESTQGAKLMVLPGGPDYALDIFGNWHVEALAGDPQPGYDPELPWVSASADLESDEWKRAVKVRQAMIMAIDRQTIIDTILGGYARPSVLLWWSNNEDRLGGRHWEYNPERARELLAEAGYADGFSITLTPSIRGAPGEVEICEAIASMWETELGLDVNLQRIPFATLQPQIQSRNYQGADCHAFNQSVVVGTITQLTSYGSNSFGATHPFLEEIMPRITSAVEDEERERLEEEMAAFLFDNALTNIGLFAGDTVWPVGPRIEEWTEHVNTVDLRRMNSYEYIRHRQ